MKPIMLLGAGWLACMGVASCSQPDAAPVKSGAGGGESSVGGNTQGAGGDSGSTGGQDAAGGDDAGVAGSGGTESAAGGSTATNTGGSATFDPQEIVPTFDGFLWVGKCSTGTATGLDCPIRDDNDACKNSSTIVPFPERGVFQNQTHAVGGTPGTKYTVNFELRGIMGSRCFTGGTQRTPEVIADFEGMTGNDGWYVGGTPVESKWNSYELHVLDASGTETGVYYLNAFPSTSGYCERHETFIFKYTASFEVEGGGTIKAVLHDANCLGQQNCGGVDMQSSCVNPRTVDLTGMSPQPPSSFVQPLVQNEWYPQWAFIDVKTVTSP